MLAWPLYTATLLMTIVGGVVGATLVHRARQEGQLADYAVATGLLCYAVMGQGGRLLRHHLGDDVAPLSDGMVETYQLVGFAISLLGLSLFTWRVYGSETRWRQGLFGAIALAGLVGTAGAIQATWLRAR